MLPHVQTKAQQNTYLYSAHSVTADDSLTMKYIHLANLGWICFILQNVLCLQNQILTKVNMLLVHQPFPSSALHDAVNPLPFSVLFFIFKLTDQ